MPWHSSIILHEQHDHLQLHNGSAIRMSLSLKPIQLVRVTLVPYVDRGRRIRGLYQSPCKRINALQFHVDSYQPDLDASRYWATNCERNIV